MRKQFLSDMMGKCVHVEVDRPMGYIHGDITYPINYGYIPGIIAGDGEAQDAYILGINKPVSSFDGIVVGAIHRLNDCEDKLVVAPMDTRFHQAQIAEAVRFQEQFFETKIDSIFRKSCGIIPYRNNGTEREYLVLLQNNQSWSFPKGHMDAFETEETTALRELSEETGLSASICSDLRIVIEYSIPPYTVKQVVLFLGKVNGDVTPQVSEIAGFRWVKKAELSDFLHPDTYDACKDNLI